MSFKEWAETFEATANAYRNVADEEFHKYLVNLRELVEDNNIEEVEIGNLLLDLGMFIKRIEEKFKDVKYAAEKLKESAPEGCVEQAIQKRDR
ncbi:hypothetical protein [Paenibacillus alvei]|uniref:Uncharacterized protein n=1 Tax=Paenibacillus alvei TaxID=44250 RepID=A0A383RFV6_PAEAL|nr:hypothetical protein [Paenibacillus alvei]SYX85908.1 protein of unknown function [Paenibacillus alvei]